MQGLSKIFLSVAVVLLFAAPVSVLAADLVCKGWLPIYSAWDKPMNSRSSASANPISFPLTMDLSGSRFEMVLPHAGEVGAPIRVSDAYFHGDSTPVNVKLGDTEIGAVSIKLRRETGEAEIYYHRSSRTRGVPSLVPAFIGYCYLPETNASPARWLGSGDARLGAYATLGAALLGAVVTGLMAWLIARSQLRIQRDQLAVARDALEHQKTELAERKSLDELLHDGPRNFVSTFSDVVTKAAAAVRRGNTESIVHYARAVVSVRDGLLQTLSDVTKPLNSNINTLSTLLKQEPPDYGAAATAILTIEATLPYRGAELEAHLRKLLVAVMVVANAEKEKA